jgi:thioredoxin-dependent peroxiredoxin
MKVFTRCALALCAALPAVAVSHAGEDRSAGPKVGDPAPGFEATDDQGKPWKSADHVGKRVLVIYFYPADLTGGCTRQACAFRDDMKKLKAKGVEVVGVSGDSARNHRVFKKVHNLNFTLLADEDGSVAKKFSVPLGPGGTIRAKDADGKEVRLTRGVTAARWTFVIGKDGKVAYRHTKVDAAEDSKKVLAEVEKLRE